MCTKADLSAHCSNFNKEGIMSYFKLEVEDRKTSGSSAAKALRRIGKIPTNFYYHGRDSVSLAIDHKVLNHALHSGQHVFEVSVGGETIYAMIKELQYHPVTEEIIHVDLQRVRRTEKMTFTIPLAFEGDAIGVKAGGILTQVATTIAIECLPGEVPEHIVIDISNLEMNAVVTAGEIALEGNISLATPAETTIAIISPPKAEIEEVPVEEEIEGEIVEAEGAPTEEEQPQMTDSGESSE